MGKTKIGYRELTDDPTLVRRMWYIRGEQAIRGMTLEELSKKLGQHETTLSRKLGGKAKIYDRDWEKLAEALDTTVEIIDESMLFLSSFVEKERALHIETLLRRIAEGCKIEGMLFLTRSYIEIEMPTEKMEVYKFENLMGHKIILCGPSGQDVTKFVEALQSLRDLTATI